MIHLHYQNYLIKKFPNLDLRTHLYSRNHSFHLRELKWDEAILKKKIYNLENVCFRNKKVNLEKWIHEVKSKLLHHRAELVFFRFSPQQLPLIKKLKAEGWYATDKLSLYFASISKILKKNSYSLNDSIQIQELQFQTLYDFFQAHPRMFAHGRFYHDPHLAPQKIDQLYQQLLIAICRKPAACHLGLYQKGKCIGFASATQESIGPLTLSYLWQIYISPSYQGKGYAKILLLELLKKVSKSSEYMEIGTQVQNESANHLYQKLGFKKVTTAHTYHLYLGKQQNV